MEKRLVIFSGLPGTGKTALARRAAGQLGIPLLAIDDVTTAIPEHMSRHADPYWDDMIHILLELGERQLEVGLSVIIDSVFMGADRAAAETMAARQGARYRPIHTYVSDERVWEARVYRRVERWPEEEPATWARIQEQRQAFLPWRPGSALFVDAVEPLEANLERVLAYITSPVEGVP